MTENGSGVFRNAYPSLAGNPQSICKIDICLQSLELSYMHYRVQNARPLIPKGLPKKRLPIDTTIEYTCYPGHKFKNDDTRQVTCLSDGTWSQPTPECIQIDCGRPPLIDNGLVELQVAEREIQWFISRNRFCFYRVLFLKIL